MSFSQKKLTFNEFFTLPQVFFQYFASKNQLLGFYISGTLVENGQSMNFQFGSDLNLLHVLSNGTCLRCFSFYCD